MGPSTVSFRPSRCPTDRCGGSPLCGEQASPEGGLVLMSGWTEVDFRPTRSTTRSDTSRTTPGGPRWTTSPAPIPAAPGRCAKWARTSRWAASALSSPARRSRSPTRWKLGCRRRTSTASISPMRSCRAPSPTSSINWYPELQRRGRYKRDYAKGVLRHKLFGRAARLHPPHPAAGHRWSASADGSARNGEAV